MPLTFADSHHHLAAHGLRLLRGGALGGVTAPLRVFQDFFVDIDLPTALTQNDEVAFPVAVYNYLKNPQTVKLDLQQEDWFALADGQGLTPHPRPQAQRSDLRPLPHPRRPQRPLRPDRHGRRHEDVRRGETRRSRFLRTASSSSRSSTTTSPAA